MPAPRRAILADISEQKLDPNQVYTQTNKSGKFVVSSDEVVQYKKKETKSSSKVLEQKLSVEKTLKNDDELIVIKKDENLHVTMNEETNDSVKATDEEHTTDHKESMNDVVSSQIMNVTTKSSESSKKKQKKK
ncbi:MAG: hypothetical protein EBU90_22990 [Proteobacteria bacterium]|nr:hypothetical protein [Pseudomonadota bacterium]